MPDVNRAPHPASIEMKRSKGWRKPPEAMYVGRPGKWGNPYPLGPGRDAAAAVALYRAYAERAFAAGVSPFTEAEMAPLRGRPLACWCPLDQPCHADVLLDMLGEKMPNRPEMRQK